MCAHDVEVVEEQKVSQQEETASRREESTADIASLVSDDKELTPTQLLFDALVYNPNIENCRRAIAEGADVNALGNDIPAIFYAVANLTRGVEAAADMVASLLDAGARCNVKVKLNDRDITLLEYAQVIAEMCNKNAADCAVLKMKPDEERQESYKGIDFATLEASWGRLAEKAYSIIALLKEKLAQTHQCLLQQASADHETASADASVAEQN